MANKTQITRLQDASRRAVVRAERALAVGDLAAAEAARSSAAKIDAKVASIRSAARRDAALVRADERAAQRDAIEMSESLTVVWH